MVNDPKLTARSAHSPDAQEHGEKNVPQRGNGPQELPEDYAQWLDDIVLDEETDI